MPRYGECESCGEHDFLYEKDGIWLCSVCHSDILVDEIRDKQRSDEQ